MTKETTTLNCSDDSPSEPNHSMDIQKAKEIYGEYTSDILSDVRSIVDLIRNSNISEPLSNSNYLHALAYTDLMLAHTQNRFQMLTGCAGGGFLHCLCESFAKMLARLKKNGGTARVILVNSDSRGPLDKLASKFPGTLQFIEATAPEEARITHFIVGDEDMARDEEYHSKFADHESAELIKAKVYFRNNAQAFALNRRFDAMWKHLCTSTED